MPHETDKKPDKTLPVLRKDNVKDYTCPWCGTAYPSRQALHYHLHNSQADCVKKQEAAERLIAEGQQVPLSEEVPKGARAESLSLLSSDVEIPLEISEAASGGTSSPKLEGDTPPIPLALLLIVIFVLAVLGLVVFFWDTLYKFARKHLGGEAVGSLPE